MKVAHLASPVETGALAEVVERCVREIHVDDLAVSPRGTVRVVSRRALLADMLDVIDLFARRRLEAYATQLARREEEAQDEGRMRVLTSLADLLDLVETLAEHLDTTAGRALRKRIERIFATHGFTRIGTIGAPFDPCCHEAVDTEPSDEHEPGAIVREISAGFARDTYVLRVARVTVAQGATA